MARLAAADVFGTALATAAVAVAIASYVLIPFLVARRRQRERGTPTRSTMKFALIFTFLFEAMWASIPLVPSIFLRNVLHGALNLVLVIAWAALIVPLGVAAVSKLMQPLSDQDLDAFMSFRRRD